MINDILTTIPSLDFVEVQNAKSAIDDEIVKKFDKLLNKTLVKEYNDDLTEKGTYYSIEILQQIKKYFDDKDKINAKLIEYYDIISNNIKPEETMSLIHLYSGIDVGINNLDVETIFERTFSNIKDPNIQWAISSIAKEMLQAQQLTPDQMYIYGSGHYSKTIKIGEYIFKVGKERTTPKIKNDERIIQPLFRREIGDNEEKIFIEVQDLVDKNWYEGLTQEQIEEELYKVYSEMRDRGIKWTDVNKENVGRLLKPNTGIYNVNGQELKGANEATGFIETEHEQKKILDVGELVIIDTDFIFDSKQEEIEYGVYSLYKKFEERYIQERAAGEITPTLLASAVEISKDIITHKDIQTVAHLVVNKDKEHQNNINNTKEWKER